MQADLDYDDFSVRHAKVVDRYTGIIRAIDADTAEMLARALKARQVYQDAIAEARAVESTMNKLGEKPTILGDSHPAMLPYRMEAAQHKAIAHDMYAHAKHYHDEAMNAIDRLTAMPIKKDR